MNQNSDYNEVLNLCMQQFDFSDSRRYEYLCNSIKEFLSICADGVYANQIIYFCNLLYGKGFFPGTSGNVSVRLAYDRILITPSCRAKNSLKLEDLIMTDLDGKQLAGNGIPSSEIKMHLAVYRERSDVNAAVHVHSPYATAYSVSKTPLLIDLLAEARLILGQVPLVKFAKPSTEEVPDFLRPYLPEHNAFLLANHGTLTLGANLEQAAHRAETLEFTAQVNAIARGIGELSRLP